MPLDTEDDQRSITSNSATLVDRSDYPINIPLLPGHSTRASKLSHDTTQGKLSTLEYMELTFSLMFVFNNRRAPLVVAINEDYQTLLSDIQREFIGSNSFLRVKELGIVWGHQKFGTNDVLQTINMVAMMRLLKSRNGVDMIMAKSA